MKQIVFFAFTAFCMALNISATHSANTCSLSSHHEVAAPDFRSPALPLNFETEDQEFSGWGGVTTSIVDDPKNQGNKVLQLVNSGTIGGAVLNLSIPIDLTTKNRISMQFNAPNSGVVVKLTFFLYSRYRCGNTTTSNDHYPRMAGTYI